MILLSGIADAEVTSDPYDCSTFIPRSAIRKVTELTRSKIPPKAGKR